MLKPEAVAAGVAAPGRSRSSKSACSPTTRPAWSPWPAHLLKAEDKTAELAARGIPAFVLYGEDDNAWPAEQQRDMAARLNAERTCIPGAAHSPNVEAPATTAHALTKFWNAAER